MSDCLLVLFADIPITASNMNRIFASADLAKPYFGIPGQLKQILRDLTTLALPMTLGTRKQILRIGITYGLGGYNLSGDSNLVDDI